jgi:hypothetical protein
MRHELGSDWEPEAEGHRSTGPHRPVSSLESQISILRSQISRLESRISAHMFLRYRPPTS